MALHNEVSALRHLFRNLCWNIRSVSTITNGQILFSPVASNVERQTVTPSLQGISYFKTFTKPSLTGAVFIISQQRFYAKGVQPKRKKLSFHYSGDLVTQPQLNPDETHTHFKGLAELESAPEVVKRLCSLTFASGEDKKIHRKEIMKERILKLFGPEAHREMHVAMLTVDIRNLIPHVLNLRKDKVAKVQLIEKIQARKKILKFLRKEDYQRFMWLLKELQIRYVLPPEYYRQITIKFQQKERVWKRANALRLKKIAEYRQKLENEWEEFKNYKEEALKQIEEDIAHFQLDREMFEKGLQRKREGKIYPRVYSWEEREKMEREGTWLEAIKKTKRLAETFSK